MLVNAMLGTVGAVAVAFYVRFLVALSRESKRSVISYWLRLRTRPREQGVTELESDGEQLRGAA